MYGDESGTHQLRTLIVINNPFFSLWQDGNHLKFIEALYFYVHPYFGPKNTFQSNLCTFSSKSGDFIYILNRNERILAKKDYFYLVKSGHFF